MAETFAEVSGRVEAVDEPGEHARVGAILDLEPHLAVGFVEVDQVMVGPRSGSSGVRVRRINDK